MPSAASSRSWAGDPFHGVLTLRPLVALLPLEWQQCVKAGLIAS